MNDIGATCQVFINTLFMQLHGFRFICLLQPRFLTMVDSRVVTLDLITHFITIQLFLRDESRKIYTETFDLFRTNLGQYSIILRLPWFRKHLPHIQFDKNTITFNSFHSLEYCSLSHQAVSISSFNTLFDHLLHLSTLSNPAMNFSNADDFAPNPHLRLLSYHRYCPFFSPYQAVNIFNIDKPNNCRSCSTSLSTSS